jgi:hypothetical protein
MLAKKQKLSVEECLQTLKDKYDGYHFHYESEGVYNPFSLLKAFFEKNFGSYWFETGTPTFLVKKINSSSFDVQRFTNERLYSNEKSLSDYRIDNPDLVPLLYQTGYLPLNSTLSASTLRLCLSADSPTSNSLSATRTS